MAHLAKADAREQKLVLADKLANMRAIMLNTARTYGSASNVVRMCRAGIIMLQ